MLGDPDLGGGSGGRGGGGRGLSCTKAVAGLLDLAGSVSKDSTTFCCFFKKAFIYET